MASGAGGAESASAPATPSVIAVPASSPLIGTRRAPILSRPPPTPPPGTAKRPGAGKKSAEEPDLGY
jgi:hypothetical protein